MSFYMNQIDLFLICLFRFSELLSTTNKTAVKHFVPFVDFSDGRMWKMLPEFIEIRSEKDISWY